MTPNALPSLVRIVMIVVGCSVVSGEGASVFQDRHVLVVGIDGCRPDALLAAEAPHLHELIANGVTTFQAFAGGERGEASQQATSSGPGWSSILTGVWIDKHGISNNDFTGDHFDLYPHFFQRLKEIEPASYLSSIVSWNPIDASIVEPVDAYTDYRRQSVGSSAASRDRWVRDDAVAHLQTENPDVLFLHFDQIDVAGHASGYGASIPPYLRSISSVDALIGDVLDAIEARPNRQEERWLIVVTTDHGGLGSSHGGQSSDERTIFFLVSGEDTSRITSDLQPGHTAVPATVVEYLGRSIDDAWGWEEPAFGLPPYPPSELAVTAGVGRDLVVRWSAPIDLEADQLILKRNGRVIAELPLSATQVVDVLPPIFLALQLVYTLEVKGAASPIEPLRFEMALSKSLEDSLVLHWPLDGDASDVSGLGNAGASSGNLPLTTGAFAGQGIQFGNGVMTAALTESLTFGRFTPFSISLWLRSPHAAEGVVIANKPTGVSDREGWLLSLTEEQGLRWNLGDGLRQVTVSSAPGAVAGGEWHHLGLSVERLQSSSLYIDGQLVGSADIGELKSSDGHGPLALGSDSLGLAKLAAELDDLRLWRRHLTSSEWKSLHDERAAPSQWRKREFTFEERFDPNIGLWDSDPDGDGRTNLEEFALGSDHRIADPTPSLRVSRREGGEPVLMITQRTGGSGDPISNYLIGGTRSVLEVSTDLLEASWRTVTDEGDILQTDYLSDGTHHLYWQPKPGNHPLYFRLQYALATDAN